MPKLMTVQTEGVAIIENAFKSYKGFLLADVMGYGKAQAFDTPILTLYGWKQLQNIGIGDTIFSSSGQPCTVTGVFPQGEKDIYNIEFSDNTQTNSCLEHLWVCQTYNNVQRKQGWQVKTLEKIKNEKTPQWIPTTEPIQFPHKQFTVPPYTLGALIGDGYLCGHEISISSPDPDIVQRILGETQSLCQLGAIQTFENHKSYRLKGLVYKHNALLNEIRNLDLNIKSIYKFIPEQYLHGSIQQRWDLLHGLMDTDGTCQKKERGGCSCSYSTSSKKLAYAIKQLVLSLGGRAKIHLYRETEYLVIILLLKNPFWCKRKSEKWVKPKRWKPIKYFKNIECIGRKEAICISVDSPDNTYITENYIVTHNTAQAIKVLKNRLKEQYPILIICPAYLIYNWLDELEMWGVNQTICVIDSGKQILHDAKIYITSYDLSVSDGIRKQLLKKWFQLLLCDEIHALKAWNSKRARRILGNGLTKRSFIAYRSKNILGLTGTPILNSIDELYNLVFRLAPATLNHMSKDQFMIEFSEKIYSTPWGMKYEGLKNEERLKQMIAPVVLARTEIKGLPERVTHYIRLKIKGPELKKYIEEENKFLEKYNIKENDILNIQKIGKLDATTLADIRHKATLYKLPHLLKLIKDLRENKTPVIVYVYYRETLKILKENLKIKKSEFVDGSVTIKKRHEIVKKFQAGKIDLLCATIGSLREGVNLTASSYVIIAEMDYTPGKNEQAIGRLHRKGQKNIVSVYYMFFESGIDKHVVNLVRKKSNLISKIF
jgi:superfamily II DNA or RNA helicase